MSINPFVFETRRFTTRKLKPDSADKTGMNASTPLLSSLGLAAALTACDQRSGFAHFAEAADAQILTASPFPEAVSTQTVKTELERSLRFLAANPDAYGAVDLNSPSSFSCDLVPTRPGYVFLFNLRPREAAVFRLGSGGGYHVTGQHGDLVTPSELTGYLGDTGRRIYLDTDRSRLERRVRTLTGFSINEITLAAPDAGAVRVFAAIP